MFLQRLHICVVLSESVDLEVPAQMFSWFVDGASILVFMNNRLYVGNLSAAITEQMLLELFSKKGEVSEVKMTIDRATGGFRGSAYVTMASPGQARAAMDAFHSSSLGGRYISVNEARPEDPNPPGQIGESYKMKRGL